MRRSGYRVIFRKMRLNEYLACVRLNYSNETSVAGVASIRLILNTILATISSRSTVCPLKKRLTGYTLGGRRLKVIFQLRPGNIVRIITGWQI